MFGTWKTAVAVAALWLALAILSAQAAGTNSPSAALQQDDAVRNVLMQLQGAIGARNIDAAVKLFAENAMFIDQCGDEVSGWSALRARLSSFSAKPGAPTIGIHPQAITFPADNVALAVGEVSRKDERQDLPVTRFAMVLTKKNGAWSIDQVTETPLQAEQMESRLPDLGWMIGQWSAEKPNASAQLDIEWAPSKKFITSRITLTRQGMQPQVDTQVIGWDPQHRRIISWHFDSNGGFGSGVWNKQPNEDKWIVDVAGISADGSDTTASNSFTLKNADQFLWQSINRSLDGAPVADTEQITVHRVKH